MFSIMKGINICARCAEAYRNERLASYGLSGNHAIFLLHLCRNPGISQEKLSRLLCINKSNVARQLVVLEEKGFVRRESPPEDKRLLLVYPTEKAIQTLPSIKQVLHNWSCYVTEDFTPEERLLLTDMLEKITQKSTAYLHQPKEERPSL